MQILFIGDIFGKPGREIARRAIPALVEQRGIDFVIANVENSAAGFGVTGDVADTILSYGVDVMTSGNHIWDKKEVLEYLPREPRLLRPANFPAGVPGRGSIVGRTRTGEPVGVLNLMGRVFMTPLDDPFAFALREVESLAAKARVIFVDFHAEATSEKIAMGWHLDGRVTAVVGTHTHVQTADERILPKGTACLTDAGMTGPARLDHRRDRRRRAGTVRQRNAGQVRSRDGTGAAERGHHHRRSEDRARDGHRAAQPVGRRGRERSRRRRPRRRTADDPHTHRKSPTEMSDLFSQPFEDDRENPSPPERRVVTVSELTASIRGLLESGFGDLWVEGEVSNCRLWNTGHLYFTLKDGGAQIKAVMYRSAVRYLKFKAEDGLRVVARGPAGSLRAEGRIPAALRPPAAARPRRTATGVRAAEEEAPGRGPLRGFTQAAAAGVAGENRHRDLARRGGAAATSSRSSPAAIPMSTSSSARRACRARARPRKSPRPSAPSAGCAASMS